MRRLWKQKWLVVLGALTMFLSIGAAAWAISDDGSAAGNGPGTAECTGVECSDCTQAGPQQQGEGPGAELRERLKERREQRLERYKALVESLRDDMTPADQALYDQLVQEAKDKQEALREAREDLADTLKELRTLTDKYLDLGGEAGGV